MLKYIFIRVLTRIFISCSNQSSQTERENKMNLDRVIVTISVIGLIVLAGCAGMEWTTMQMESDSKQYSEPLKLTKNRVTVTVYWKTAEELKKICGGNGCAVPITSEGECNIFTEKPRSWNSAPLQKRLGHEFLHCLGGQHE